MGIEICFFLLKLFRAEENILCRGNFNPKKILPENPYIHQITSY